ncbi:MAG: hypothetical protein K2O34_08620 [Acetatifactor sp.]|nr:hypothetical protein [Acetatifactor sp.]
MWHCNYGKEPFDMRLFVLLCLRRFWVVMAGAAVGLVLIGGIYYLKNVTFGGVIPYVIDSKYYLEYAVDPSDQQTYSYFASFTWNDLLKSDSMVQEMLGELEIPMTAEELTSSFTAELISDLRICYIHTTHVDAGKAREIDRVVGMAMVSVCGQQKELKEISLLSQGQPRLAVPDVRTLRACVLGVALGIFFSVFGLGLWVMLEERVYVPGTLAWRYGIPVAGYVDKKGMPSGELASQLTGLLQKKQRVGVTAVNGELDLGGAVKLLEEAELPLPEGKAARRYTAIPSLWQAPEAGKAFRDQEGIVLLVQAGGDRGKAIEETLRLLQQLELSVDAMILAEADDRLIRHYTGIKPYTGKSKA